MSSTASPHPVGGIDVVVGGIDVATTKLARHWVRAGTQLPIVIETSHASARRSARGALAGPADPCEVEALLTAGNVRAHSSDGIRTSPRGGGT